MDKLIIPAQQISHARTSPYDCTSAIFFNTLSTEKKKRNKRKPLDTKAPRMVTIKELATLTGMSEYFIRRLCKEDKIIHFTTGVKILINYDRFIEFLNGNK